MEIAVFFEFPNYRNAFNTKFKTLADFLERTYKTTNIIFKNTFNESTLKIRSEYRYIELVFEDIP